MIRAYWRTRTSPAQTGILSAPRSVEATARSRRSLRSGSRDTDAARTAWAHEGAIPSPTWSARERTSVSTRALWTPVAFGTEVRAAPVSSLPEAPRSRWSRLSGSGLSRENQAVTGHPVARLAHSRVESSTALTTVGTPAASANASSRAAMRSFDRVGGLPLPVASCSRWAADLTSASSRERVTFFAATRWAIIARSSSMPQPCRALTASTGTPGRPSSSSRRRTSSTIDARRSSGTVSMWLSTTSITSRWPASGLRNRSWIAASAYFCGSSPHTSMSASCTSRSTSRWWDTSVESWSGRSSSTTPRISTSSSALDSIESRVTWWRAGMVVASSTIGSSTRPRAAIAALSRPSTRAPMSELLVTSFLAPSRNYVMTPSPDWVDCFTPTLGGGVAALRHPGGSARRVAQVVDLAGRGSQPVRHLGRDLEAVEQVGVAAPLGVEQVADGRLQLATRPIGEGPDGLVAEDGLEQLLAQQRRSARDTGLGTGDPRRVREDHHHERDGQAVDAEGQEARSGPLVGALGAHHVEHVGLPVPHRPLGPAPEVPRGPPEVLTRVAQQDLAGRGAAPRGLGALRGRLGVLEDERLEARLDRDGDPLGLLRLALDRVDDAVAEPADARLQRLEQLAGAD